MASQSLLTLYVAGNTLDSRMALTNLDQICRQQQISPSQVEVVDVLKQFEQAESDKIIATPTLILRSLSSPAKRLVGNLSDRQQVLREIKTLLASNEFNCCPLVA